MISGARTIERYNKNMSSVSLMSSLNTGHNVNELRYDINQTAPLLLLVCSHSFLYRGSDLKLPKLKSDNYINLLSFVFLIY